MRTYFTRACRRSFLVALGLACLAVVPPASAQVKEPTKLTFSLDFIPLGRHAAWYAAVGAGLFREEGLEVTIIPAQGTAQVLQAVDSGLAQIGLIDVPGLVLARAAGSKIKMVAINYQKSPYAIFSLSPGAAVTRPEQLEGLKLGSGAGSFTPKVIQGFMTQKGLDPAKLEIANVAPAARANLLLTGQVPAIEFFVMSRPGLEGGARAANAKLETFLLADHGLDLYSLGIAATDAYIEKNPDVMKRFVRAALRGWKLTLDDPKRAAAFEKQFIPTLNEDGIQAEIETVRDLAVTADTRKNGLGWFDPAKFQANLDFVVKYIGVTGTPPIASDLYATGFLPETPVLP
ncbi:NitT/TauT family transport system substrate-binding protein [Rhizobiales bacterium GAS188]|nr:NitT/TauT family transport system substrate-binding protein [Rhizobiales bacterium GAS188]